MQILIVQAQPDGKSLTAAVINALRCGVTAAGHAVEVADLCAEVSIAANGKRILTAITEPGQPHATLRGSRRRSIVPTRWSSSSDLLVVHAGNRESWIDRVFISGWAFRYERGKVIGTMRNIPVHVVGIGGGNQLGYDKHGYERSFSTQIEQGIFRFCGIECVYVHLMLDSESAQTDVLAKHLRTAFAIGETLDLPARGAT